MPAHLIFVESNTTGTGMLALSTARRMGLDPVLLTGRPQRYPGLADTGTEVIECDTNSMATLGEALSRCRGEIVGVTTTSEYYLAAAAELALRLGLPGNPPAAVRRCRNKASMRQTLHSAGVEQPRFITAHDHRRLATTLAHIGLPCVVKPVDESGSQDVRLCHSEPQVRTHLLRILAAKTNARGQPSPGTALVEEYLGGREFSVEMFSRAGVAHCVGITAKSVGGDPYFVELGHHYPAAMDRASTRRLIAVVRRALDAVGIREGPTHTEVRLLGDRASIVEINVRLAGGMIPELIRLVDGIDLLEQQIRAAIGQPVNLTPVSGADRCAGIRFITVDRAGPVLGVTGVPEASALPGVRRVSVGVTEGGRVSPPRDAYGRVGHVIATGASRQEVADSLDLATGLITIAVEPDVR